jgi:hypothetical protein
MEVLLDCTDQIARVNVSALIKFIVQRLKVAEADILNKTETITTTDDKGQVTTIEQPASLCARFIMKCLSLLNTQVAKSWSRFDQFLEILLTFGFGEEGKEDENLIGLEFYMNIRFVERVCDFILGKKSPLCMPNEKRIEMGGSFSQPNFTPLIKMLTKILTNQELLDKYPLSDLEKKMFLDAELLKILLSNQSGGK